MGTVEPRLSLATRPSSRLANRVYQAMNMINGRVIEELLQEPLGPYRDCDVLYEACQMKGANKLVLYSFLLEVDGRVTGLDESELKGQDDRRFRFRGVLKIADPNWLSEFGYKTIEAELNLRANERAVLSRRIPELTIKHLFERYLNRSHDASRTEGEMCLMVLIQGERNFPAVFMHSLVAPDGLFWSSKAHKRCYQVATMDVETYSLSENFFWRWRLFALMQKISTLHPYVPPKKRIPMWYIERYMARFACPPEDKYRRIIFDEEDSDVDEAGRTVTPRHPLKPHTSEILGLFAAHANWFATNNASKSSKLLDTTSWMNFAKEMKRERQEATRRGVAWGLPRGRNEEPYEEVEGAEDEIGRVVEENPVIGKPKKTLARKIELARDKPNNATESKYYSSDSESDGDAPRGVEYVSDFSEPSDAEENDPDRYLEEVEAVDRIPWQLQVPPLLPDVDGRWWCPLQDCNYEIDLYHLTEEDGRRVPDELIGYVLRKQWRNAVHDKEVVHGFRCMVTNHYMKHFEASGVKVEKKEGKMRFSLLEGRQRRREGDQPTRGPLPVRGTLGGESRVIPIVHAPQAGHFQ